MWCVEDAYMALPQISNASRTAAAVVAIAAAAAAAAAAAVVMVFCHSADCCSMRLTHTCGMRATYCRGLGFLTDSAQSCRNREQLQHIPPAAHTMNISNAFGVTDA